MTGRVFAGITPGGLYLLSTGAPSHFSVPEMTCRCGCGAHQVDQRQVDMLEAIRNLVEQPVHVNSGVRCWPYHQHVYQSQGLAVVQDSQHIPRRPDGVKVLESGTQDGATRGTDITVATLSPKALRHLLEQRAHQALLIAPGEQRGRAAHEQRQGFLEQPAVDVGQFGQLLVQGALAFLDRGVQYLKQAPDPQAQVGAVGRGALRDQVVEGLAREDAGVVGEQAEQQPHQQQLQRVAFVAGGL